MRRTVGGLLVGVLAAGAALVVLVVRRLVRHHCPDKVHECDQLPRRVESVDLRDRGQDAVDLVVELVHPVGVVTQPSVVLGDVPRVLVELLLHLLEQGGEGAPVVGAGGVVLQARDVTLQHLDLPLQVLHDEVHDARDQQEDDEGDAADHQPVAEPVELLDALDRALVVEPVLVVEARSRRVAQVVHDGFALQG